MSSRQPDLIQPQFDPTLPADTSPVPDEKHGPVPGIALCLSGGGYRAMLFHLGSLWRLNELGYLPKLNRISSVSGGSITAALLGLKWNELDFQAGVAHRFVPEVVEPIRALAGKSIDWKAVLTGGIGPGSIPEWIAAAYRKYLYKEATLQDLAHEPNAPRFVINASNVQSGALWRFMRPYIRDYRVGEIRSSRLSLATAVAASSAFPPLLSPLVLKFQPSEYQPNTGMDLQFPPYTTRVVLTDGGVYDNLGLETAWKRYRTILVSDGGGKMAPEPDPKRDPVRHTRRVLDLIDNQVRSLRKRQVIGAYRVRRDADDTSWRDGTYWGIRTNITKYGLSDALTCPHAQTLALAEEPTRLASLTAITQERLINWGYAVCDAAMRRWVVPQSSAPSNFPYPDAKVG